jgi:hypothetical protein
VYEPESMSAQQLIGRATIRDAQFDFVLDVRTGLFHCPILIGASFMLGCSGRASDD